MRVWTVAAMEVREGDWLVPDGADEPLRVGRVQWIPDDLRKPVDTVRAEVQGEVFEWAPAERVRLTSSPNRTV